LFLVPHLGLANVLHDDQVFFIMGKLNVARLPSAMRVNC
jgi:hypothetical protein